MLCPLGTFYACFPFLKLASWLPGGASQTAINAMWRWAGGQQKLEDAKEQYHVDEKLAQAGELRDRADRSVLGRYRRSSGIRCQS